jgi:hypothetical protein
MVELHQVARVQVADYTLQKAAKPLSLAKKNELRTEKIIAYIKAHPNKKIEYTQFSDIAGFKSNGGAKNFVLKLVKQGVIYRDNLTPSTYHYWTDEAKPVTVVRKRLRLTPDELEQRAMHWAWQHPEDHDSLHGFIAYMKTLRE